MLSVCVFWLRKFNVNYIFSYFHKNSGLSARVVKNNDEKAVPGTGKEYQVPEYFGFNRMSYHEAEVEMEKFRIAQPVAPRK